jgi:hypothetical protein
MAIRIRKVKGKTIALCAAETFPKEGDVYLDDNIHHALSTKFGLDWKSMGFLEDSLADEDLVKLMEQEAEEASKYDYNEQYNFIVDKRVYAFSDFIHNQNFGKKQ